MPTTALESRTVRLTADRSALVIRQRTLTGRETVDAYFLRRVAQGWIFSKHDGQTRYLVEDTGERCSCPGHRRHRHCKHCDAVRKLTALGKLS